MGFLFSEVFWGVLLILLGISVVVKVLFHLNIPVFRIVLALILIYIGIQILMGGVGLPKPKNSVIFDDAPLKISHPTDQCNVIFGQSTIDLTEISVGTQTVHLDVNTIFGKAIVKIDPQLAQKIIVTSAFAEARMPDGNRIYFGDYTYKTNSYQDNQVHLVIKANVVFGGLEIIAQ